MTGLELTREIFPDLDDDALDYILWEHTGFPSFFPKEVGAEAHFRQQLEAYRDANCMCWECQNKRKSKKAE